MTAARRDPEPFRCCICDLTFPTLAALDGHRTARAERDELARRDAALDADTEWDGDENDSDAEAWSRNNLGE